MPRSQRVASVLAGLLLLWSSSARADDAKGTCIAAADEGQSLRDDGRYQRARAAFTRCADDGCPRIIARSCAQWLRQLVDAIPTVVLGAKDEAGLDLTAAQVTLDGDPLTNVLDGKPLAVDPGDHRLRFEGEGRVPVEVRLVLRAGEKNRVVAVTLSSSPGAGPTILSPSPSKMPPPQGAPSPVARNATALSVLALGGAALAGGAYFVAQAGSESGKAAGLRAGMPTYACTDQPSIAPCQQLHDAVSSQRTDATAGAVFLAGGSALVLGAVVSWLVWPRAAEAPQAGLGPIVPAVSSSGATLELSGWF